MNEILQVIGSKASLAGIPLAVFIHLRQKEAKYRKLHLPLAEPYSLALPVKEK